MLDGGSITADQVVLAVNAWAAQIPEIGAGLMVVASDVIATEAGPGAPRRSRYHAPASASPTVAGSSTTTTPPPTAAWSSARAAARSPTTTGSPPASTIRAAASQQIRSQLLRTYPALWDVPVAEAWSGPIDYSLSGLPFFVRLREAPERARLRRLLR